MPVVILEQCNKITIGQTTFTKEFVELNRVAYYNII